MSVRKAAQKQKSRRTATPTASAPSRVSRGPVDAPGKRHRTPLPPERVDARMGEPRGKQMGQKGVKSGWRSGRR